MASFETEAGFQSGLLANSTPFHVSYTKHVGDMQPLSGHSMEGKRGLFADSGSTRQRSLHQADRRTGTETSWLICTHSQNCQIVRYATAKRARESHEQITCVWLVSRQWPVTPKKKGVFLFVCFLIHNLKQNEAQCACAESTHKGVNLVLERRHINTTTKSRVAHGNSHLSCK